MSSQVETRPVQIVEIHGVGHASVLGCMMMRLKVLGDDYTEHNNYRWVFLVRESDISQASAQCIQFNVDEWIVANRHERQVEGFEDMGVRKTM